MERQLSIPALWAAAHHVPSGGGVGVLRARARSGRDGPPSCVSWVQFFASEAVGVGSSRTESVSVTHPAGIRRPGFRAVWIADDRESAVVGVGGGRSCVGLTTESTASLRLT
ncbi:hypothetical protein [Amycolatopsis orientalis]|uniref:hypothetical protein n=1 Tax=Amycolatopsis orientalis TaxID=31958 RepID=UPI001F18DF95|nr:hypothetical protein [Amycolatopsis orientalis]